MTPEEMLGRLRNRFAAYNMLPGVNKAQFRAQMLEEEMVLLIRDVATAPETAASLRLECARTILTIARGVPQPWFNRGETIDPEAKGTVHETVGAEMEAMRVTADTFSRLDDLVRRKVPYRLWPEDVRGLAEAAAFSDAEPEAAD